MTQDEFQMLVLQELKEIKSDVGTLKSDVGSLKSDVSGLKSDVSSLKSDVGGLKSDVRSLKSDVGGLKSDVSGLKSALSALTAKVDTMEMRLERVENKQLEQSDILSAMLHNQEVARAEIEALKTTTATNSSIQRLDAKFSLLNDRLFEQETELQVLKLVK